jgi:hypothetical protein
MAANINITFKNGQGKVTADLFRNGKTVPPQGSVDQTGVISFPDATSGDFISLNGVCTADAFISIDVPTHPPTPDHFHDEVIMSNYRIL